MFKEPFFMPNWSRYRGKELSFVPRDYLVFLLECGIGDVFPKLEQAIEDELLIRDLEGETD